MNHTKLWTRGKVKRGTNKGLRLRWLTVLIILLGLESLFVYFHMHDAILVISLHLNIKLDWIRELETNCLVEKSPNDSPILKPLNVKSSPLPDCPEEPPDLFGSLKLSDETADIAIEDIVKNNTVVLAGGKYTPKDCYPRSKVAIIVPHRERELHLRQFLKNIHPVLRRQQRHYGIYVVHQSGTDTFNKAKLLNIGFIEALKDDSYDCFIFHDVDLVAEDDRNLYQCADVPKHLAVGIDKWGYQLPYNALFGGVIAMKREHFEKVNGYSNEYWGWGAEDDDMYVRILHSCLGLERAPYDFARYRMVYHPSDERNGVNPYRYSLLVGAAERQKRDGLVNLQYSVLQKMRLPLYTNITADVGIPPSTHSMGSGIDIVISISLACLLVFITICSCFKSRIIHVIIQSRRRVH